MTINTKPKTPTIRVATTSKLMLMSQLAISPSVRSSRPKVHWQTIHRPWAGGPAAALATYLRQHHHYRHLSTLGTSRDNSKAVAACTL